VQTITKAAQLEKMLLLQRKAMTIGCKNFAAMEAAFAAI